jgi:tetratricopeptide (TPR) repeat protein
VESRETWQALQARLTNARAALEAGDRSRALDEVNAALSIDPHFLAAHSFRDRIIATPAGVAPSTRASQPVQFASAVPRPAASPVFPAVEGYARFEQKAKRRRVDRRLDAARLALETGKLKAAAAALDEVIELDPNLPDLKELTAAFDNLRRKAAAPRRGPHFAAAAVFVAMVLGASWLHESTSLISRPMIATAPPLPAPPPLLAVEPDPIAVAAASEREAVAEIGEPVAPAKPVLARVAVAPVVLSRLPIEVAELTPPSPTVPPQAPAVVPAAPRSMPVQEAALEAPVNTVAAVVPPPSAPVEMSVNDSQLVKETLQHYRVAYEGLDARRAQAVWPAVNQAALARAFDGLQSQSLTFDACDVRVRGEMATATCQGSARYVPKIGSREPRTEKRVWNFSLHKAGDDWKIQSARADR